MTRPRTQAGRALDDLLFDEHSHGEECADCRSAYREFGYTDAILAIEAEALPSVERLAAAMGSIGTCGHSSCPRDTSRHLDDAAAILADLRERQA